MESGVQTDPLPDPESVGEDADLVAAIRNEITKRGPITFARFMERAAQIRQGDPRDEDTQIGPNIHLAHVSRVQGFVDRAKADGATVVYGGEVNADLGPHYYRPTLIRDASAGSEILTQEVFGPVLTMQTF